MNISENKKKLKIALLNAGIYQGQLAEYIGMRKESLSRKIKNLTDETLQELLEKIEECKKERDRNE